MRSFKTYAAPFIYNGQYAIIELLDTCKEYGASFVWIYLIANCNTIRLYLDVSMCFFFFFLVAIVFVCLFVFVLF
jgi:hypothetical protein